MSNFQVIHCPRCKTDINIPSLTKEEKMELTSTKFNKGEISTIEMLRTLAELDLKEAKAVVTHLNKAGHCNRCNYDSLQGENMFCPKCKSFNLNWP